MNQTQEKQSRSRVEWLDSARGICLIMMIVCHSFAGRRWAMFNGYTGLFFLVFFFLCSGLCLDTRTPYPAYIKKQFRKLIVPYLLFAVPSLCCIMFRSQMWTTNFRRTAIEVILSVVYSYSNTFTVFGYQTRGVGPVWFFTCLFMTLLLYRALYRVRCKGLIILALAAAASISQKYITLPLTLQDACIGCMFVWIGDAFRERWFALAKFGETAKFTVAAAAAVGLSMLSLVLMGLLAFLGIPALLDLGSNVYSFSSLPVSLLGFGVVILCAVLNMRMQIIHDFLCFYGKNSFQLLILHSIDIVLLRNFNAKSLQFLFATIMVYPCVLIIFRRFAAFAGRSVVRDRKKK